MSRRVALALPLLAVASLPMLGLAGCSTTPAKPSGLSADYTSVNTEYQTAKGQLTLPTGVTFPAQLPRGGDHYPPGAGTNSAQTYWFCAWLRDYLNSPPTATARAKAAAGQLPKFKDMTAYTKGLGNDGRTAVDAAIKGAQGGTKQEAGAFAESSCGGPFYGLANPPA